MARERRSTAEESAAVPGQRPGNLGEGETREGDGPPAGPVAPTAESSPLSPQETPPEHTAPDQVKAPEPPAAAAETRPSGATPAKPADHKIRHTRLSGTWAAVVGFGIVLLLLLIFILQNGHTVEVSYLGAHGHLPLGVSLLLAAVAGILLVALAGSARMMQLRATARKHRRADVKAARADAKAAKEAAKTRR